jgi:hypothetical protein
MKRLKLKNGYHDSLIRAIQYVGESDIMLDVDLCSCCNVSPGRATLCLNGVRNFAAVREALEIARNKNARHGYIDEIAFIRRAEKRGYLLVLHTGGEVLVDAQDLHEV